MAIEKDRAERNVASDRAGDQDLPPCSKPSSDESARLEDEADACDDGVR